MGSTEILGIVLAIIASICWSLTPALFSLILKGKNLKTGILGVNALRFFGTLPLVIPVMVLSWQTPIDPLIILLVFIGAFFGPGLGDQLYLKAISISGSAIATPLSHVYVIFVQILAILLLGEEPKLVFFIASVLVLFGVWVVYGAISHNHSKAKKIGVLVITLSLFTGLSWAIATVVSKYALSYINPALMFGIRGLFLLFLMNMLAYAKGEFKNIKYIGKLELALTLLAGFIGLGLGVLVYIYALYFAEASRVAVVFALIPVLNQFLAAKVAKETITKYTVIGALLVSLGILLVSIA